MQTANRKHWQKCMHKNKNENLSFFQRMLHQNGVSKCYLCEKKLKTERNK